MTVPLSPRELEVARLIAEDLSDKQIAQILQMSVDTVNSHLKRIAAKLGAGRQPYRRRAVIARWMRAYEAPPDARHASHAA